MRPLLQLGDRDPVGAAAAFVERHAPAETMAALVGTVRSGRLFCSSDPRRIHGLTSRVQSPDPAFRPPSNFRLDVQDIGALLREPEPFLSFDASVPLRRWTIAVAGDSHPFTIEFQRPSEILDISIPLHGSLAMMRRDREQGALSADGSASINHFVDGTKLRGSTGALTLIFRIPISAASAALAAMGFDAGVAAFLSRTTCLTMDAAMRLRRAAHYVLTELASDPPARTCEMVVQGMDDVLSMILLEQIAAMKPRGPTGPLPAIVRRAEEYMLAHAALPLSISEIASAAGTTSRNLQLVFAQFLGQSPMRRLREIRLDRAREELNANGGARISDVAQAWGFSHFGRFSADYRARFGELPSRSRLLARA
jgi:AraC-like DNA-binding protein